MKIRYFCLKCRNPFFSEAIVPRCTLCHTRRVVATKGLGPMSSPEPTGGATFIDFHNWLDSKGLTLDRVSGSNRVNQYRRYLKEKGFGLTHFGVWSGRGIK